MGGKSCSCMQHLSAEIYCPSFAGQSIFPNVLLGATVVITAIRDSTEFYGILRDSTGFYKLFKVKWCLINDTKNNMRVVNLEC